MLKLETVIARSLLSMLFVLQGAAISWAAPQPGKGKGGGGGDSTTLPAVRYQVHAITSDASIVPLAMNNAGMIVGYTYPNDNYPLIVVAGNVFQGETLDSLALVYGWPVPPGFRLRTCTDVNELGVVVGGMGTDDRTQNAGFALDTQLSANPADWTLYHLPNLGYDYSIARAINDFGDIVANYRPLGSEERVGYLFNLYTPAIEPTIIPYAGAGIPAGFNNFGQMLFSLDGNNPSIYQPGQPLITFTDANYRNGSSYGNTVLLNDAGVFAWRELIKRTAVAVRRSIDSTMPLQQLSSSTTYSTSINQQNDVLLSQDLLYHDEFGIVNLDKLILTDTPLATSWINANGQCNLMTDRSNVTADSVHTRFPMLVGRFNSDGVTYLVYLIPVAPPQ